MRFRVRSPHSGGVPKDIDPVANDNDYDTSENLEVDDIRETFRQQGLVRARHGRLLAGVVAGLGRRVGLDPWPARLVFLLLVLILPGCPILLYPLLWVLMPKESDGDVQSPVTPSTA
jgi:phage shock protein PspC (stress-responsive transcriptional regulator)